MRTLAVMGVACLLALWTAPSADDRRLAFTNVTVVDVDNWASTPDQTVVVDSGRIVWRGPAANARIPRGTRRVSGAGRYLAPGLADMHAHVGPHDLPLYLAASVTTVREMNGDTARLRWRTGTLNGSLAGPTLIVGGPLLAGAPQRYRHVLIATAEEARAEVRREAALGFDFVKVYDGLSRESYAAIVAMAKEVGLPVSGHVPDAVGAAALTSGQRSIEHITSLAVPDTTALAGILDAVAESGVWVTPTMAAFEALTLTRDSAVWARFDQPDIRLIDRDLQAWWRSVRGDAPASPPSPRARARWEVLTRALQGLVARGVPLLAGTDTPNPLMIPGVALHEELRVLEHSGVSRRAALSAATFRPAEYLGTPRAFGVIERGTRADLVLLGANPFDSLSAYRTPIGVMARGRWYDAATLSRMREEAARRIASE